MWYVLDAAKDARLVYGLKKDCTKEQIRESIEKGKLSNLLQSVKVNKDDLFFVVFKETEELNKWEEYYITLFKPAFNYKGVDIPY